MLFDRKSARDKPALIWEPALWLLRRKFSQWEMWDSWDHIYFQLNASQRLLQTVFCTVDNSSVYNSALDNLKSSEVLQNKSGFNWYT